MRMVNDTQLWLMVRALKVFYKDTGRLPVPGKVAHVSLYAVEMQPIGIC